MDKFKRKELPESETVAYPQTVCRCGEQHPEGEPNYDSSDNWSSGTVTTPAGDVARVRLSLTFRDRLGSWRVRWGIGRSRFRVRPGLYAVGDPSAESAVLVTANFKMSFDRLRSQLAGLDVWVLVLDTKGVNVWCSAGKGTFSTEELLRSIESVGLSQVVSHRRLVLPQLSATGVSAPQVRKLAGWHVVFGPVCARDIREFLAARMRATPEMRRVRFPFRFRATLVPLELVQSAKYFLIAAVVLAILSGLSAHGYSFQLLASAGLQSAVLAAIAWFLGAVATPLALPWIPLRAFSAKGALLGAVIVVIAVLLQLMHRLALGNWFTLAGWALMIPAISSFLAMNFTGASTFTSLSGVRREIKIALPLQLSAASLGTVLWLIGRFA
jgi:hypothetical protein